MEMRRTIVIAGMAFAAYCSMGAEAAFDTLNAHRGGKGRGRREDFALLVEKKAGPLEWLFPTGDHTPHEGMAFADGVTGVLAWGGGETLKLTVSRADLWDHRGGYTWTEAQSYTNITDAILKGDKERLLGLFKKETPSGEPRNPFMLPLGRVEVKIPGATLKRGTLNVKTGLGRIAFELDGKTLCAELAMSKASRAFSLKLPDGIMFEAKTINAMELGCVKRKLAPLGYKGAAYTANGFTWKLPADESVSLAFEKNGTELAVRTWRGEAKGTFAPAPFATVRAESAAYWAEFWQKGARVKVPDPVIQGMFDYGMYRFGAMTDPDGVPAGLQGPWIEDNDLPPWSGDYHFNINVQECYAPAYRGGHFANLMPLFKMIFSWKPILRDNARKFAGVDGYVLPHSVSDRGVNIGGFWAGTIDHGSTAWVADMMWRYVKYSGDVEFLRRDAYDYMSGAMRVYRAMMVEDGKGALAFPTGPSPEWGGSDFNKAVGRNPSFQLAAAHRLARDLIAAAAMLGEAPDAMWLDVEKRLPLASVGETGIEIFEGKPLTASHRHHSHMAGLFPFDIFDLSDAATAAYVEKTYRQWRAKGDGGWTGWCVPWAAVLNTHAGRAADAVDLLHKWDEYFTNPGHASRHNKWKPGFGGGFGKYPEIGKDGRLKEHEIMMMDGQCAFTAAVLEMMAHEVNGKTEFFKGCPQEWKDVSFENIALSDGRRASGRRVDGRLRVEFSDGTHFEAGGTMARPEQATLIAHRGGSDAPENTFTAYKESVEAGFGFECDVYLSKDGRLFTIHDPDLRRSTGGAHSNIVTQENWDFLSKVNVASGKWKGTRFDPTAPALLEDVLKLARDRRWIYVEVKTASGVKIVPYLKKVFAAQNKATPMNTLFISFDGKICAELKRQMPEYKAFFIPRLYTQRGYERYKDPQNLVADLRAMGVDGVDAPFDKKKCIELQTAEYIKAVKDAGLEYHVWTCNKIDQVEAAFARGVQTVTTDVPKKMLEERARREDLARLAEKKADPLE